MLKLNNETIEAIEKALDKKKLIELHIEKGNIVIVEINRKVTNKIEVSK